VTVGGRPYPARPGLPDLRGGELARRPARHRHRSARGGPGQLRFGGLDKVGLGMGVVAALLALVAYGRPVSRAGAWAGVLILGLILAAAAQAMRRRPISSSPGPCSRPASPRRPALSAPGRDLAALACWR